MKLSPLALLFFIITSTVTSAQITNVTRAINSKYDEQNPVLMPGETHLFYTIANHPENIGGTKDKGDIWYSIWQDSVWSMPIHAGNVINNTLWNGVLAFTLDGNNMLLHNRYSNGRQGISMAKRKGKGWQKPQDMEIPYFMNKSKFQSGSLSPDGSVILLAIESYGTIGAEDIYACFKKGKEWTEPKNLGVMVNTKFQEMTPIIADDNKTLFFASNGHGGEGSMDILKTVRLDDSWMNWETPETVSEVNTFGRELSFSFDPIKKVARYVTTQDSDGYGDIRYFEFKETLSDSAIVVERVEAIPSVIKLDTTKFIVQGLVKDKGSLNPIGASITASRPGKGNNQPDNVVTTNGQFRMALDSAGTYQIKVASAGYLLHLVEIVLDSSQNKYEIEVLLSAIVLGEAVTLEHVLFERASTKLIESSYQDLNEVVEMMKDSPTMEIELSGHTDNQGSSKLNLQLSKDRVEVVKKYITSNGIQSKRIEGKGYGGTRPIASNKNPELRKFNRRVEFTVIKE